MSYGEGPALAGLPHPPARKMAIVAACAIVAAACTSALLFAKRPRVIRTYAVPTFEDGLHPVLEDVSAKGLLIMQHAWTLSLWDSRTRQATLEVRLQDWQKYQNEIPGQVSEWPGPFRFQKDGRHVVGMQTPWIVLIDLSTRQEVRRALPSKEYIDPNCASPRSLSYGPLLYRVLSLNPRDDSVAAAFNIGKEPRLFIYDSTLERQIYSCPLPRYVQDLAWSPDGKKLAVLYNGHYDDNRQAISVRFADTFPQPDVWTLDPQSGRIVEKFRTGTNQAHIAFSGDGSLLYTINDDLYSGNPKGALRAFSVPSGKLVQTFWGPAKGYRNTFALSPAGKFIAIDASTEWRPWYSLEFAGKISRFVLLDGRTGQTLFRYEKHTNRYDFGPLPFAFSPDGYSLFVDFPSSANEQKRTLEVFSLEGLY